eukprot:8682711-Alexandrium_andersonii.AAC.1
MALFASCSKEFQRLRSTQAQQAALLETLQSDLRAASQKLMDLDAANTQQILNFSQRTSALESRLVGDGSASAGATPNPSGPQS